MVFILLAHCPNFIHHFPLLNYCNHLCSLFPFDIIKGEGNNMKKEATDTLTLRVPISMKVQIEIAAHKDGRTINSWVNQVLKEKLNEGVKK